MIISAKTDHHSDYRPYSTKGAIADAVLGMEVGATILVEEILDSAGCQIGVVYMRSVIGAIQGDRVFKTRVCPAPLLATIYRVA